MCLLLQLCRGQRQEGPWSMLAATPAPGPVTDCLKGRRQRDKGDTQFSGLCKREHGHAYPHIRVHI